VFFYLIPDTEEETIQTDMLKLKSNFLLAKVMHAQLKYLDALKQVEQAKADLKYAYMDKMAERAEPILAALRWLKARVCLDL